MKQPSKLMCQLGSLSRGLDKENSEFEPKSRDKLALKLRKVVNSAQKLEAQEFDLFCRINGARDIVLDLMDGLGLKKSAEIEKQLILILDALDGVE
ncbi:hypothetical protein [Acinetobacter baumannii]|uniref:hypothetical protein n=1 Tax=Acinetobacter baumannii TaxID=470 RepID=UPI0018886C7A|nr:hypothetical protein [Acinetobacter baumannii]MBF1851360.1 hypothetical protein [Acinetobacter baumannii]HCG3439783.1 hypothetical protein [Acinetobacter baumannii]HDI1573529.1 hypothetical protein [Acinetobacter baumannii]